MVHLFLARDDVTCLAVLPHRISIARRDDVIEATIRGATARGTVNLCDAAGQPLMTTAVSNSSARFALSTLPENSLPPACLKLYEGGRLVDIETMAERE